MILNSSSLANLPPTFACLVHILTPPYLFANFFLLPAISESLRRPVEKVRFLFFSFLCQSEHFSVVGTLSIQILGRVYET